MKFCAEHWAQLREAIDAEGLMTLVAETGEQAARNLASEIDGGTSIDNFDPLMWAHNAILAYAMEAAKRQYNQSPLIFMVEDPERPQLACPVCALNYCHEQHDEVCTQASCSYPKGFRYDTGDAPENIIKEAARRAKDEWKGLKL